MKITEKIEKERIQMMNMKESVVDSKENDGKNDFFKTNTDFKPQLMSEKYSSKKFLK